MIGSYIRQDIIPICTIYIEKSLSFMADVFGLDPEVDAVDYEVEIPVDIVKLANEQ